MDSIRNCRISCVRAAPTTFLIPTSLERRVDLAVDRFMKFMQAIVNTKAATAEKI